MAKCSQIEKVYGPYLFNTGSCAGRKYVTVCYKDGSTRNLLYSRHLMEKSLGRRLDPVLEVVDHINGDKTDDRLENLQILSNSEHTKKHRKDDFIEMKSFRCPSCGCKFDKDMRTVRWNQKRRGSRGPFCSKSCSGRDSRERQLGRKS